MMKDLITPSEAAKLIPPKRQGKPVSASTVVRWGKSGRIKLYQSNGYRVSASEILHKFRVRLV